MADSDKLIVELVAKVEKFQQDMQASMKTFDSATGKMTDAATKLAESSKKSTKGTTDAFAVMAGVVGGELVIGAFNLAKDAALSLASAILGDGIDAAVAQEKAMLQLSTVLKNTGENTLESRKLFSDFADEMEGLTNIGDDVILKLSAMGKAMGQTNEETKQMVRVAADLSVAMGIDVEQAMTMLGGTLNGTAGKLEKLNPELGNLSAEALRSGAAVDILGKKFQGLAGQNAKTFEGSLLGIKNQFGNFTEAIGTLIKNNSALSSVMNSISNGFKQLTLFVEANKKEIAEFITQVVYFSTKAASGFVTSIDFIIDVMKTMWFMFKSTVESVATLAAAIVRFATGDFSGAAEIISKQTSSVADEFESLMTEIAKTSKLEEVATYMDTAAESSKQYAAETNNTIEAIVAKDDTTKKEMETISELMSLNDMQLEQAKALAEEMWKQANDKAAIAQFELETKQAMLEREAEMDGDFRTTSADAELAAFEERFALLAQQQKDERDLLNEGLIAKNADAIQSEAARKAIRDKGYAEWKALEDAKLKQEDKNNKAKLKATSQALDDLGSLTQSKNKTLFGIGKAANIAKATIDGYTAIQNALATVPYPFNIAAAAGIGVKTAMNISKIKAQKLATGIDQVPGIGSQDNFPALLAPNERVVPAETNKDLTKFLEGMKSGGTGTNNVSIQLTMNDNLIDFVEAKLVERKRNGTSRGLF